MMMGIWVFFFILIICGVVILIILASKRSSWALRKPNFIPFKEISGNNTLELLKERYAKGDISKEEFDRIKKDIS